MGISQLILSPKDPDYLPDDIADITTALSDIQLLGAPLSDQKFQVGNSFLDLIGFLGCSPNIELEPREDSAFCHFEFPSPQAQRTLICSNTIKPPVCPECRTALPEHKKSGVSDTSIACPHCGKAKRLSSLIWRQKAMSFTCWNIVLWNIFDGEAVPSSTLMDTLQNVTGTEWRYSYITR